MQLTSNLHFIFTEENKVLMIREQIPGGRTWTTATRPEIPDEDYAIVGRLLDSKTGQFLSLIHIYRAGSSTPRERRKSSS